jgi:hypothetical protein
MPFTYCQSCGHKNLYSVEMPKFCGECGTSLVSKGGSSKPVARRLGSSGSSTNKRMPPSQGQQEQDDTDGSDIYEVPEIGEFKCSVSSEGLGNRKMKLGDLLPPQEEIAVESPPNEAPEKRKRRKRRAKG